MATRKQIRANRKNAQKSTGPKTEAGKAIASLNATKHGLYSQNVVIDSPYLKEDPEEFEKLCFNLMADLDPHGPFQYQLVIKIATCMWRQRRVINAETAWINHELQHRKLFPSYSYPNLDEQDVLQSPELMDRVHSKAIPQGNFADTLMRYQYRLERDMLNAFKLLQSLKKEEAKEKNHNEPKPRVQTHPERPVRMPGQSDEEFEEFKNWRTEPDVWESHAPQLSPTSKGGGPALIDMS